MQLLPGPSSLVSNEITVGIGAPANLTFAATVSSGRVIAGEFFQQPPRVELRDAGGNLVTTDSISGIQMSISTNPSGAQLTPKKNAFVTVKYGVGTFSSVILDKVGQDFRLMFSLYKYSALLNSYSSTKIFVISEAFDVVYGPARKIRTAVTAGNAWAGGSPMGVQPKLQFLDFGDNVLTLDYQSVMSASLLSSLSVDWTVTIDTSKSAYVAIKRIDLNLPPGTYGAGQFLLINVTFGSYVTVSNARPYLVLNIQTLTGSRAIATAYGSLPLSNTLLFSYTIQPGDASPTVSCATDISGALKRNGSSITDGLGRPAVLSIPNLGITNGDKLQVDTSQPVVTAVGTYTSDGNYGVGQVINIFVTFNFPVVVVVTGGSPYLTLNAQGNSLNSSIATYVKVQNASTILFSYQVLPGHNSTGLGFLSSAIALPSNTFIKRASDAPVTDANLDLRPFKALFIAAHRIIIDPAPPILDATYGVRTTKPNGKYYAGEVIILSVKFNKPVIVIGSSITLSVEDNVGGVAVYSGIKNDSQTLYFTYTVGTYAFSSDFDIKSGSGALKIYPGMFIRRLSTYPTTDVNTSTLGIYMSSNALSKQKAIELFGYIPVVKAISVVSATQAYASANILHTDDSVLIQINFSTPLILSCNPVFVMIVGYEREAVYVGGNLSSSIMFKYTAQAGDTSTDWLYYRFAPNALCAITGCPGDVGGCSVLAYSMNSNLPADLSLPQSYGGNAGKLNTGVPFARYSIDRTPVNRSTFISRIQCLNTPGNPLLYNRCLSPMSFSV